MWKLNPQEIAFERLWHMHLSFFSLKLHFQIYVGWGFSGRRPRQTVWRFPTHPLCSATEFTDGITIFCDVWWCFLLLLRIPTSASRILVIRLLKVVALLEDAGAAGNCKSATRISTVCFWYVERRFFVADLTNERFSRFRFLFGVASLLNGV